MSDPAAQEGEQEPAFEDALEELRAVVADLEAGTLGLEASLARFEAGVGLLKRCQATLDRTERRVELLLGENADGEAVTEPFDASATADQSGAGRRSKPVKKAAKPKPAKTPREKEEDELIGLF